DIPHMDNTSLDQTVETVGQNEGPAAEDYPAQEDTSPADMLRIKQQMANQCFEMTVQLNAGKSKRPCSTSQAERELPDCVSELEHVKTVHFNSTLALHRIQMWNAIAEKMKQTDPDATDLKAVSARCMALCSQIKRLQMETRNLQDEITEIQKERLEIKRLTHEKMKETQELLSNKEQPDSEKYKALLEKGQVNVETYKKMIIMAQNVLRGILLACKVNWLDEPNLREIVMTLEDFPISD
uniref:Centromere protein H C-terminal domain-containing protein n=3 Tax=Xiphophorus couchianus TaxID=32473 RepID=A0A3B5ME06_9TELE